MSTDEGFVAATSAQFETLSSPVSVSTVDDVARALELLEEGTVDGIVTDATTALSRPALLERARRRPQLALLVCLPFGTERGETIATTELLECIDVGDDSPDAARLEHWLEGLSDETADSGWQLSPEALVGEIKQTLVDTTEPIDIEHAVCDRLVDAGVTFAWIGEYDRGERRVVPWATASATEDWPTTTFGIQAGSAITHALCTRESIYVSDIDDSKFTLPWQKAATARGCQSMVLLPLCSEAELVGLFGAYTAEPLTDTAREALKTIGEATGAVLGRMVLRDRIEQQGRSLQQYERLVETAGDGMYTLDADGHFVTVNDTLLSMTGYSREGILGEPWTILAEQPATVDIASPIDSLRATDETDTTTFEASVRRKDGSTFPGENRIALLQVDGSFGGTVGVLRDVTERKQREQELKRQNERVEAFASIVSHDLRNPLGVAMGHLERDDRDQAAIDQSKAALERMETIIDDVLALARHGDTATDTALHSLRATAVEAWQNVETEAARLVVRSSRSFCFDRSRVLRLFENCFRNTIEHGGPDRIVTVGCCGRQSETTARAGFYVADDGPGLDPKLREHAFDSAVTTSEGGHGLGLWIVREVAEAHGWTVRATESTTGGARFEFTDVSVSDTLDE